MSLSRVKVWISEVLSASDLNAEFNNVLNYLNGSGVTLASPVISGTTTLPGSGAISSTGLLGIGMTPTNVLDITQSQNAVSKISLLNANAGTAAQAVVFVTNSAGNSAGFQYQGGGFTTSGVVRQDGLIVTTTGAGGLTINTGAAQPIYFSVNNSEAARFDTSGRPLFGATTALNGFMTVATGSSGVEVLFAQHTHASNPDGYQIQYSAAAPNDTAHEAFFFSDTGATRATIRSNGGLANFSANNVNLSDIRVKPAFELLDDAALNALQASFIAIDFARFKYDGQTHDDWNYGYSAQGVETAFALTVPAMTDVWNPTTTTEVDDGTGKLVPQKTPTPAKDQLRAVYTEDLHNIAHALLARALTRIAALEARLAAAHIP